MSNSCIICNTNGFLYVSHDMLFCKSCLARVNAWNIYALAHGHNRAWQIEQVKLGNKQMSKQKHTHKYHKVQTPKGHLWCCALPDCSHHQPSYLEAKLVGKRSICWSCDEEMILDDVNMQDDKPMHHTCKDTGIKVSDIEHLADILKG